MKTHVGKLAWVRETKLALVTRLLATAAALWVRIQPYLNNTKWAHKQRSGQNTLACQKMYKTKLAWNISLLCMLIQQMQILIYCIAGFFFIVDFPEINLRLDEHLINLMQFQQQRLIMPFIWKIFTSIFCSQRLKKNKKIIFTFRSVHFQGNFLSKNSPF